MLNDSAEKYKHYNPAWSFAYAAAFGAASVGGAAIGSAFVKGAVELTKNIATVYEDLRGITPDPDEENGRLHTSIHPYEHFILTDQTPRERS